jgi:Beta-lactamase superfamily domain
MGVQFHVLASGSSGNACVLDVNGFGVLVDFGLSPKRLAPRMKRARVSWDRIHAAILTHTHTDHWRASTLSQLAKLRLPLYCHAEHLPTLGPNVRAIEALATMGLIHHYEAGERLTLQPDCACVPIALAHDGAMTCGFRFEGRSWAIGYATDLGSWHASLARHLADVDLLALEFNHDVAMQLASGRHPLLIRRVLGDEGHLSNEQAADLLTRIVQLSESGRVKHVVQLHLSRDCNHPDLAGAAARRSLEKLGIALPIYTTVQGKVGPTIRLGARAKGRFAQPAFMQPMLAFD